MALVMTYGTFDFLAEGVLGFTDDVRRRLAEVEIPRRHGVVIDTTQLRSARLITLRGQLWRSTAADLETIFDTLKSTVSAGRQQLKIYDDRYIYASVQSFIYDYIPGSAMQYLNFSLGLLCDQPFFEDVNTNSKLLKMSAGSGSILSPNLGSADTPPTITVTVAGATLTAFAMTNSTQGKTITWSGSVAAGSDLVINMETFVVTEAGTEAYDGISGEFWDLKKSVDNNFTWTYSPDPAASASDISLSWRKRYS